MCGGDGGRQTSSGIEGWLARKAGSHGVEEINKIACLALVLPVLYVFKIAAATGINGRARLDEEVCRWDNIDDGRASGILAGDPEGNRDIVVCTAVSNGEKAVKTEQEVRASVVKGIDIELGTKGGDDGDGSVEMGVNDVGVAVRRCLVA